MKERIKIIMSDIDGTLLTSQGKISPRTYQAIKKVRENGILFGIATGRALEGVLENTKDWGINDICDIYLGYNGAHVLDYSLHVDEHTHLLDGKYMREIIEHFSDLDVTFMIYIGRTLHSSRQDEISSRIAKGNKFIEKPFDMDVLLNEPRNKLVIGCHESVMDLVMERSKTFSSPHYRCFRSGANLFEYVHPDLSKSYGIEKIAKLHGYSIDNVLAFGDADNDTDMLRDCGVGVCMENGSENSKKVSDYITKSNDQDGIAIFIEEHLL